MFLKLEIHGEESLHSFDEVDSINIGKSDKCDLVIDDPLVSRHHGKVILKDDTYFYVDMDSKEGSFLNGELLKPKAGHVFNTFFPITLGKNVHLYLMDEEITVEPDRVDLPQEVIPQEKVQPLKIKPQMYVPDSAGTITADASKVLQNNISSEKEIRREKTRNKKKPVKRRKSVDRTQQLLFLILILIFSGFIYYKKYKANEEKIFALKLQKQKSLEASRRLKAKKMVLQKEKEAQRLTELQKTKNRDLISDAVTTDKCLLELEKTLCTPFKGRSPRDLYEGYSVGIDSISLVIDVKSIKQPVTQDLNYSTQELNKVVEVARKSLGAKFHEGFFRNKLNLRLMPISEIESLEKYLLFTDFLLSKGIQSMMQVKDIKKLNIVGMNSRKYTSHLSLNINKIKELNQEDVNFAIKVFFRSSITLELDSIIESLKIQ